MSDPAGGRIAARYPLKGFLLLSLGALGAATVLSLFNDDPFVRFFGDIPPPLVVGLVTVAGGVSLRLLHLRGWHHPWATSDTLAGVRRSIVAAVVFAVIVISFDLWITFPEDMNTRWPESVLFYPAVAFVAEVVFHVAPLAMLVLVLHWRFDPHRDDRRVWVAVAVVAILEALFQVADALSANSDLRLTLFVGLHLFAIGIFELVAFRRFGFISMIAFRLSYYLLWHIAWGHARLNLLF